MKVKEITVTIKSSEGSEHIIYSPEGKVLSGDEQQALKLKSTNIYRKDITVTGTEGESINANFNVRGTIATVGGDPDAVNSALNKALQGQSVTVATLQVLIL